MPASTILTLEQWNVAIREDNDGVVPCPNCDADGDCWPLDGSDGEIAVFDCDCGSRAEIVTTQREWLAKAYLQLRASCPVLVFVPPGPRSRLWEHAK